MSISPDAIIGNIHDGTFTQGDITNLIRYAGRRDLDSDLGDIAKLLSGGPQLSTAVVWRMLEPSPLPLDYSPSQLVADLANALGAAGHSIDRKVFDEAADEIASCVIMALHGKHLLTETRVSTDLPGIDKYEDVELGHFTVVLGPPISLAFHRRTDTHTVEMLRTNKRDHLQQVTTLLPDRDYEMARLGRTLIVSEVLTFVNP